MIEYRSTPKLLITLWWIILLVQVAGAQTFTILYQFPGGRDGQFPTGVALDASGNLYGTTFDGGRRTYECSDGCGTIFEFDTARRKTIVYQLPGGNLKYPDAGLILDSIGNIFATTVGAGASRSGFAPDYGAVFEIDMQQHKVLVHHFNGEDGLNPQANLTQDSVGNVYGTTPGWSDGGGVIFRIDTSGEYTALYKLVYGEPHYILGGVVLDPIGNIYGTTFYGGDFNNGVVFKLDPAGEFTIVHSFPGGPAGRFPWGSLVMDVNGNLYGMTQDGGAFYGGTIFKVFPDGKVNVIHSFSSADGARPNQLTIDSRGNLYGATLEGGLYSNGNAFELKKDGTFRVLHDFRDPQEGRIVTGLAIDKRGDIFGSLGFRGYNSGGTLFKITPKAMSSIKSPKP